jgi:DNA-binding response OmpR family regulator
LPAARCQQFFPLNLQAFPCYILCAEGALSATSAMLQRPVSPFFDVNHRMPTADKAKSVTREENASPASGERKQSLLVVEDDENILTMINEHFSRAGYSVKTAKDGIEGVQAALNDHPDVVILDLMLPKMDGLGVCRELREKAPYIPILMVTAKDDVVDKVLGLEMGADDYITKPFSLRELEARIKSVLRRVRTGAGSTDGANEEAPITRGKLRIDPSKREVMVGERQVELTPKEFDLLRLFATNPGRVFPRKYLLEKIWDYTYEGYDRTIDSHINRLRAKIEDNPENPQMVLTVWGIGYKFYDE